MRIVQGKRCSGKTTALIIESNSSGLPIITATKLSANYVAKMASEMKIDIPKPICILEALARGRVVGDCLIDELQGSINCAFVDGDISEEQCDYLYEKYIRGGSKND